MHGHSQTTAPYEPRIAVQSVTRHVVLCDAPLERFSATTPVFTPRSPEEEEWRPVDVLYGSYDPAYRRIEVYIDNIRRDARLFGEFGDVLQIVRLHEYAHAVVHLGVRVDEATDMLAVIGPGGHTDWDVFVQDRTRAFDEVDAASHEYLAQAVTLAALSSLPDGYRSERLKATFEAVECRQPPQYVVPDDIRTSVHLVDWSLVIAAARRDVDVFRGSDFSLLRRLSALAREFALRSRESSSIDREWIVEFPDQTAAGDLRDSLSATERRDASSSADTLELKVDRFAGLRIEVFAREHPPPHFRVICGGESANYRIADCAQLNGGLRRQYRVVRAWHAQNKAKLIDAWNRHRSSDCPVGEYREA
jgi:uncharacterized protein DUF4160